MWFTMGSQTVLYKWTLTVCVNVCVCVCVCVCLHVYLFAFFGGRGVRELGRGGGG